LGLIRDLSDKIAKVNGRTLVIGHYAGHGAVDQGGLLGFFASPSAYRPFTFERTLGELCQGDAAIDPAFERTDVVFIIDSCYSGQATRGLGAIGRSVEIIASVGADQKALGNVSNSSRVQNRTFTSRLADRIAVRVGRNDSSSISFAEIIGELRRESRPERLPEYELHVGRVGIRVPILGQSGLPPHLRAITGGLGHRQSASGSSASEATAPETPQLTAMFSVHIDGVDASSGEIQKLVEWIHSLHPMAGLEVTAVFQTRSTVIIFHTPWHVWAQMSWLRGAALICEPFGRNRLPGLSRPQQMVVGRERKENRPPGEQPGPGMK
jgi:hypothetical protein